MNTQTVGDFTIERFSADNWIVSTSPKLRRSVSSIPARSHFNSSDAVRRFFMKTGNYNGFFYVAGEPYNFAAINKTLNKM